MTTLDASDSDDEVLRTSCGAPDAAAADDDDDDDDDDDAVIVADVAMLVVGDARFDFANAIRRRSCVCAELGRGEAS